MFSPRLRKDRTTREPGFPDRARIWPGCGTARRPAKPARTILVVDDEEPVRNVVSAVLRRHGYKVYQAADAFQGLWLMQQRPVDLVVTEIDLPVCSGFEFAYRIRDFSPRMPILFVTSVRVQAACVGPTPWDPSGLLSKPFSTVTLMDRIKRLMARGSVQVEAAAYAG